MIVVWPLIVSKTVNPNIIPGVCKALEKYIYIERMDEVIEAANISIKNANKKSSVYLALKNIGGKMSLRLENLEVGNIEDYLIENGIVQYNNDEDYIDEAKKTEKQTMTTGTTSSNKKGPSPKGYSKKGSTPYIQPEIIEPKEKDPYKDAYEKQKAQYDFDQTVKNETPVFGKMDQTAITSEPTWNTVTDQKGNTHAIGVKVVPYIINNEQSLITLMTQDRYRTSLNANLHIQSRKVLRFMHRVANFVWSKSIGKLFGWTGFVDDDLVSGTITTNWKNDVILQNTPFEKNMFIMLNKMDLTDDFVSNAKGVKKLFALGWTSFIIADDINKTATFCLQTYKGMCSMMNYGFLYADSRSQNQVYTDIEDIKRSAGPLFRMKRRKQTMITDSLAQLKLDQYSQEILINESIYLNESIISDMFDNLKNSPQMISSNIKSMVSAVKRKDIKLAYKISKKLNPSNKNLDVNTIVSKTKSMNPGFKTNYDLAYKIFKNSLPGLDEQMLIIGSGAVAGMATINKDKNYNMKNDIKKIIIETRNRTKTLDEDNAEFTSDLKFAFAFALIAILMVGVGIVGFLYTLVTLIPAAGAVVGALWPYACFITSIMLLMKFAAAYESGGKIDE